MKTILSLQNVKSEIEQWQIDEVRKRTENYLKDPSVVTDIEDFLKEIENEL
ncbi:hypothetical protein [Flavobacterium tistrianum]|uniref:hypothetical protein n=1 Tax=Flavobacterium tistrianum TaxID=1685414 RepID=UPI0013A64C3D|nr:hypothetical protein [Flavobacterium tistrianum]KAF2342303.1 hypothetical protein DMB71_03880 [Flavobacterium tistrianum]